MISTTDAHHHATIDLMESYSHDMYDEVFQEKNMVYTFKDVIFSGFDFFNNTLFR